MMTANLTGLLRRVRDCCADLHNYIQRWNELSVKGAAQVEHISNLKLRLVFDPEEEQKRKLSDEEMDDIRYEMQSSTEELELSYHAMEKLVQKMAAITDSLKGCHDLSCFQSGYDSQLGEILFQTWPVSYFHDTSADLLQMYKRELMLKQHIMQNVAHVTDRSTMMLYVACWTHEPYIELRSKDLLEGMLLETNLR